jgi:asparagine synthase (glutamine-hydrolysing)
MCGVAGLICTRQQCSEEDHVQVVRKMTDLQFHRGPDDSGVVSLESVCLGSNRLSIIDLSEAGHMPMSDDKAEWWIVYNGEVYNFGELRNELIAEGHRLRSRTDTEVVLRAFQQWGTDCIKRFSGMFAFAIYDRKTETVTLVRDRLGKKPLYYTLRHGHILFASEMKALVRVCEDLRPNKQRLIEWSLYRNVDFGSSETLIDGIYSLLPGHFLRIRQGEMETPQCYYSPESQVDAAVYLRLSQARVKTVVSEVETLLDNAVRARLVSDVPLGTLCSGGIDSSLITAFCARHLKEVNAFNVSVAGYEEIDENRYAQRVAEKLKINLFTYPMRGKDFRENLPRAIYHSDLPLTHPNSVPFLLISEFARKNGVKILLSGEGADELFGGYPQRYRRARQLMRVKKLLDHLPSKIRKAIALAGYATDGIPITEFSEYQLLGHATAFLDSFRRRDLTLSCAEAYRFVSNEEDRVLLGSMLADLTNFLSPLLRRLDRMSMAASVESRAPFLDRDLTKTVVNLPLSYRLRGGADKWILKEVAAQYLPHEILYRRKVGFPLPVDAYIAPLARHEFFRDGFCVNLLGFHQRGLNECLSNWRRDVHGFFNLLALEIWGQLFFLGRPLEDITHRVLELSDEVESPPTVKPGLRTNCLEVAGNASVRVKP